jgi:hypothetical protein
MKPSLWTVTFHSSLGAGGAGVVTLTPGFISGGDATYYYLGTFDLENDRGTAEINVEHHSGPLNAVFGNLKSFRLKVSGKYQEPYMELHGYLANNPNMKISIKCTKRAEL